MRVSPASFVYSTSFLLVPAIVIILVVSIAIAQTPSSAPTQPEVAKASAVGSAAGNHTVSNFPVFTNYRGVRIGMSAAEVRAELDGLKEERTAQDFFVFSEQESAQIFYDKDGKVTAISVDCFGPNSNAPSPNAILGADLQAKPDGSMYQLNRYPDAGYWVSYNRTAGDQPIITVTMQKL